MWTLGLIETLAIAALGLLIGRELCHRLPVLHRLCLPEPVIGGLLLGSFWFALEAVAGVSVGFDLSLQTPFMIAFFLSIGWMASFKNLKAGGPLVLKFLIVCSGVLLIQNAVGMGLASLMGQNPLLGVLAGSVSLTGGPGTALAFAPAFEKAGVVGAGSIGTACALLGIVLGGLLGAPLSAGLLTKMGASDSSKSSDANEPALRAADVSFPSTEPEALDRAEASLLLHLKLFLIVMALGSILGKWIQARGITLPIYIGSMIVAAAVRNFMDFRAQKGAKPAFSGELVDELGSICLSYFLVIATMTLQFKQLASLAGVLVLILVVQAALVILIARGVIFRFFGRDYDAAVMSGGFVGFMLGTTANAMANMNAVSARYSARFGPARRAFVVVPLVGACFIDFVNALVITFLTRS